MSDLTLTEFTHDFVSCNFFKYITILILKIFKCHQKNFNSTFFFLLDFFYLIVFILIWYFLFILVFFSKWKIRKRWIKVVLRLQLHLPLYLFVFSFPFCSFLHALLYLCLSYSHFPWLIIQFQSNFLSNVKQDKIVYIWHIC